MGSYNTTIGPGESFARVPWYFANSTDAPTDLTVTASSLNLNSSLRSQRLQETLKSLDQSFVVVRQANMSQNEIMPLEGRSRKTLDANRYATKKTIAQGMLDIALLTANASQLKYVLSLGAENHPFYHLMLSLIIVSIVLQVLTAIIMFILGPMNLNTLNNENTMMILNHVALAFCFGSMFVDTVKYVFVAEGSSGFPKSPSPD